MYLAFFRARRYVVRFFFINFARFWSHDRSGRHKYLTDVLSFQQPRRTDPNRRFSFIEIFSTIDRKNRNIRSAITRTSPQMHKSIL